MPGCAAIGCNNRSEKGYSMKCFPRDPLLRQLWKERVGRANWEPSKNSFLCHDHFEADQWAKNGKGRIKLKRDAVPSIFKEISTRKSHRKRRRQNETQNSYIFTDNVDHPIEIRAVNIVDDESEDNNYTLEYLEDCEYKDDLKTMKSAKDNGNNIAIINPNSSRDLKNNYNLAYHIFSERDIAGLERENIIIVADENDREIGKLIHNNDNIIIVADENNKEIGQILVQDNALDTDIGEQENYDEIEEKLNKICNGEDVAVTITNGEETGGENKLFRIKEEDIDAEIPGNVGILFDTENRDDNERSERNDEGSENTIEEMRNRPDATLAVKTEAGHPNQSSIEDTRHGQKKNDSPRIRTPSKRRRKTREDIMRSIERVIAELSDRTMENFHNEQLTRSILRIARTRKKRHREKSAAVNRGDQKSLGIINDTVKLNGSNSSSKKSKFTIKVTGVADDVSEIIEGLNPSAKNKFNGEDDSSTKYILAEEIDKRDLFRIDGRFVKRRKLRNQSFGYDEESRSHNRDFPEGNEDNEDEGNGESNTKMRIKNSPVKIDNPGSSDNENNRSSRLKYLNRSQDASRESRQKINAQQEVIEKLTNQLIIYKGLEAKLVDLSLQLVNKNEEIESLKQKLEKSSDISAQDQSEVKSIADNKDKTISDLSNKVNALKEANKKMMRQINAESQGRKMAFNLKQKDVQIKELNWKLDKASKFLDRAQKNANTYRRKMVSLQTSIRRQKAAEEKRNHFQALLIDNAKHEFSESALLTAMDIKNSCGIKCYQKLLSYNFPLPSLRTLRRRFQKGNVNGEDWGDEEEQEMVVDSPDELILNSEVFQSNEFEETEITGTVQDIFEENNDNEELNSSEFGEQLFLQFSIERNNPET